MSGLYEQGEALLAQAEKEADFVQVHVSQTKETRIELVKNNIDAGAAKDQVTYAVLVSLGEKMGVSAANAFSPDIVHRALSVARASAPCEYFYGLPEKTAIKKPLLYEKSLVQLPEEKLAGIAEELISCITSKHVSLSSGSLTKEVVHELIFTSEGVEHSEQSASLSVVAECIARKQGNAKAGWDYHTERKLFPVAPFATALAEKTVFFAGAKPLTEKKKVVVIEPEPFADILAYAFLPNLNGKNVEKGKSCMATKKGQECISPQLTISDNGLLPLGVNSRSMDLEGTPSQKTVLFENGVLKNFIYDHNTAVHVGTASTGNGGFSSTDFTNVIVDGEAQDVDHALVIDSVIGAHTSDEAATDFSVTVDKAYILKNGEKTPVTGFMLSGKMLTALQNAIGVGKDKKSYNGIYTGSLVTSGIAVIL